MTPVMDWAGVDSPMGQLIADQSERCLAAYSVNPTLIREHAAIERATRQGGYGRRQLYELVQNGADALVHSPGGRIEVLLTPRVLYCANEGAPIDSDGVEAILSSHLNVKKGNEIGRFGIGFKSVLAVSGSPEFFSRSGSFKFDAARAAERIRAVFPEAKEFPVLRIAEPLDPDDEAAHDPNLRGFMEWATTVVRLVRGARQADWLVADIQTFPAEFLLFSPQVGQLDLEARPGSLRRELRVERTPAGLRLVSQGRDEIWWTARTTYKPSESVREDAGTLAERGELPLVWAVQRETKIARGRFWAFFPTETITTLSGILNAPWKTNEDRQNLLPGAFNEEFIDHAAALVVENIAQLVDPADPARHLDLLPSRDSYNFADAQLGQRIFDLAATRPCIPDQTGRPCVPGTLQLHPSGLSPEALRTWSSYPNRPVAWCHPDIETANRRPRAERLVPRANVATLRGWLEALVADGTAGGSSAAVRAAATVFLDATAGRRREIGAAKIVLCSDGSLGAPNEVLVALPGRPRSPRNKYVHERLVDDPDTHRALVELGVRESDALGDLRAFLARLRRTPYDEDWRVLWNLAGHVSPGEFAEAVAAVDLDGDRLAALTVSGSFRPVHHIVLPGEIVDGTRPEDSEVAVDVGFHHSTLAHLRRIGVVEVPTAGAGSSSEPWFATYLEAARAAYIRKVQVDPVKQNPRQDLITFEELLTNRGTFVGPLEPLDFMGDEARARYTQGTLEAGAGPPNWTLCHATSPNAYPKLRFASPVAWRLRRSGRVFTSLGVSEAKRAVGPQFARLAELLPVAQCSPDDAAILRLPSTPRDVPEALWQAALERSESCVDDAALGALVADLVEAGKPPSTIRCRAGTEFGPHAPDAVTVTADPEELARLVPHGIPVLLVPSTSAVDAVVEALGSRTAAEGVRFEVEAAVVRDPAPLVDEFPALRFRLEHSAQGLMLARCTEILFATVTPRGKSVVPREFMIHEGIIYCLDSLGDLELIRRLAESLRLDLTPSEMATLASKRAARERRELVGRIRRSRELPGRLLEAVGADLLRRRLPLHVLAALEPGGQELSPDEIARLALAIHGADTLREFRNELSERGLDPPSQWAGSRSARAYVRELGFPPQFAGLELARRDPWLEVEGPPDLPPLHDFQDVIADRIRGVLDGRPSLRGLVSLPTGAGKTRVVVEALVRALSEGTLGSPILWIAQTDELCEQAVQTWGYLWRAFGPTRPLRISRLWSSNEAEALEGGQQVVVATVAKLQGCVEDKAYAWLAKAACTVVDEAHGSTTPTYTEILTWLGLGRERERDRCPLIGLTATPFRGTSVEETGRLVGRYNRYRLDSGALGEDPHRELQERGVLSKVEHQLLPGVNIQMTADELDRLRQTRLIPSGVEARLGANVERNEVLLQSIAGLASDWPVLLYAASVDHAEVMAGALTLRGIAAAAISSRTPPVARRYFVEEFRAGRIRVLTNYAVLTEGFDAPAVRAVFVARPTFSPNLYQQMIGRGLRGPLNGGTEYCLVVNVEDNVAQFGEELAFRQFEYLWESGGD
jgi:superfamily II DNA or RNA helicase